LQGNVPDPARAADYYIADFSSRALPGQQLDVAAPGTWVVGPYQVNSGQLSWYYLGGTSMATPHVSGIVALMAQQNPSLTAAQAESALKRAALPLKPGCRTVAQSSGPAQQYCWDADAPGAGLITATAALGLK
jgi:subtilisin family serine protease